MEITPENKFKIISVTNKGTVCWEYGGGSRPFLVLKDQKGNKLEGWSSNQLDGLDRVGLNILEQGTVHVTKFFEDSDSRAGQEAFIDILRDTFGLDIDSPKE